ncbi:hypothetical protein XHC_2714 [Xanthomonas hortorum pv. carotae str. M081]|nr:hypothetical protein XHC_2714 [Xanthomonas hortorum pv. carotae str. M081]
MNELLGGIAGGRNTHAYKQASANATGQYPGPIRWLVEKICEK